MESISQQYGVSINRSCRLMLMSKTAYYHKSKKCAKDNEIIDYLQELSKAHPRCGFDKMMLKVKLEDKGWNHKRVYRICCEQGLNIRIKPRKRIPKGKQKC